MESSRDQIEEIKNRLDIVDVVGKYVQLKQAGKNFSGKCPFHLEKTPSFIVSPELQRYKCFGCGENGDIFNFVQKIENIDFPETLEKLAKEAGVELKKIKSNTQYQRLEEINKRAAIFFFRQIKDSKYASVLKYIHGRGINDESIQSFGIGYSPGGTGLLNYIQKDNKYSKEELLLSGLFVEKEGKLRDKFYKRVMFPIRSSSGKVIAFTGRILPNNDFGPKYMNSPETPIYHKKENVYGQYESRQEIRKLDFVIMCEGTTDVISAHQLGIKNIVAPLGTALTSEQLLKLSKLTKNILFLFDNDTAGQQALEKAFILSQPLELNTYANNTEPYKDVDEMIKEDPKGFKLLAKKRVDAYTYMLTQYIKEKDLNNFEDYQRTVSWMERILSTVKNSSLFSFYVKSGVKITKFEPKKLSLNKALSSKKLHYGKSTPQKRNKEAIFLQLILFQEKIQLGKNIDLKFFQNVKLQNVLEFVKQNPNCSREEVIRKFDEDAEIKAILEDSIFSFSQEESSNEEIYNIYDNIVKDYFIKKEREYSIKIASAESTGRNKESQKLLEEFQELTKQKKQYEQNSKL